MLSNLFTYSFIIVALGTALLSISTAIVGSINVYLKQSLIGDALGHATILGIVIFNVVFSTKNAFILLTGATISALVAYFVILWLKNNTTLHLDVILGIVLTLFFSLGLVIRTGTISKTNINISTYVFGQAAFITQEDVILISILAILVLGLFIGFYRFIQTYIFDRSFVILMGYNVNLIEVMILILSVITLSIGLKFVGIVLVTSFLILPVLFAQNFTKSYKKVVVIAIIFSVMVSLIGTYLSTTIPNLSTGPIIVVLMSSFTLLSMVRRLK